MLKRWRGSQNHQQDDDPLDPDEKVRELRKAVGPLSDRTLKFCTDACLRRYLEARNWDLDKAKKMLEDTIKWRSTYKPEEIRWHQVADVGVTGKASRANFVDKHGGTVLIMRPGKQNKTTGEGDVKHLIYLMENAVLNLPENQEQMSWLVDMTGWTRSVTNIKMKTVRDMIHLLQSHYPERLSIIIHYDPPRIFQAFYKVMKYFIDAKPLEKLKFVYPNDKDSVDLMKMYFDTENLPSEFGGKGTLVYDHEDFSRLMVEDDAKTAKFWGFDSQASQKQNNKGCSEPEVVPVAIAPAPSS